MGTSGCDSPQAGDASVERCGGAVGTLKMNKDQTGVLAGVGSTLCVTPARPSSSSQCRGFHIEPLLETHFALGTDGQEGFQECGRGNLSVQMHELRGLQPQPALGEPGPEGRNQGFIMPPRMGGGARVLCLKAKLIF